MECALKRSKLQFFFNILFQKEIFKDQGPGTAVEVDGSSLLGKNTAEVKS